MARLLICVVTKYLRSPELCVYLAGRYRHGPRVGIHILGIVIIFTFLPCSLFDVVIVV